MYEVTKWYAEDGKVFDSEEECREYEQLQSLECIKGGFLLLDTSFQEVSNPIEDFDEVAYVYTRTDRATEILHDLLRHDWTTPWDYYTQEAGSWFFCEQTQEWIPLDEARQYINKILRHGPDWFQSPHYI